MREPDEKSEPWYEREPDEKSEWGRPAEGRLVELVARLAGRAGHRLPNRRI